MDEDSEEVEVDDDDMLTCTVCLTLFDEGIHKPKFLTCHHTFCVECLKVDLCHCLYSAVYHFC